MAIDTNAYSPKQFMFLVAEQDDFGTHAADESSPNNDFLALDVDSIGSPSMNLNQSIEPRTGSRILQATDFFQDKLAKVMEFSVSGTANTETLDLLLTHITQGGAVPYSMASSVAGQTFTTATVDQTNISILSIVYRSPSSGNDLSFKDCFCTSLTLNGDMGTEGGRIKYSATFKTGSLPTDLTDTQTVVDVAISANNYYMSSWDADDRKICDIANLLVNSFSLTVDNDAVFAGVTSTGYESVARIGEVSAIADFNIKYDANTDSLFELFHDQTTGVTEGATLMATDTTPSDGEFEFLFANSILTNVAFSEGDMMGLDVSVKALGAGTGSATKLFEISC